MDGIVTTLNNLSFAQMVCAWLFVACYALALGGLLGSRGRRYAGMLALVAAAVFSALCVEWVHGALLVVFAIGGLGAFVVAAWLLAQSSAWLLRHSLQPQAVARNEVAASAAAHPKPAGSWRELWRSLVAP